MPHMWNDGWWFWGMHFLWWVFWVLLIAVLIAVLLPRRGKSDLIRGETPLEVLQRRYAAGEISTDEYEDRRMRIERDAPKAM